MSNPSGETVQVDKPSTAEKNNRDGLPIGAVAWALFEAARVPYIILISMYIFAPYVVTTLIGGDRPDAAVKGQEIFSRWNTYSSIIVMCTAPFLGASIDKLGRRKAMLAVVVSLMVVLIFSLWWAKPDHSGLGIVEILLILAIANVLLTYNEVLHNSLLVRAAGLGKAHWASGLALSLGNGLGTLVLAFATWAFVLPGHVDWAWVPDAPLFGLDPAFHEDERIVGPIAAIIILIGSLPLFFFTPDEKTTGMPVTTAFREGAATLWYMMQTVKNYRNAATFLVARLFYIDGTTATLIYMGIYLRGVMKWSPLNLLTYGILVSLFAVLGGFVSRWLDTVLGPRRAVQIELLVLLASVIAFIGNGPEKILYFWHYDPSDHSPVWNGPVLTTLPDLIMVVIAFFYASSITAVYASSRTLLTRLTPPEQAGAFFGLYALSGTATLWLGNLLVNLGTRIFGTQEGGFAMIIVLLSIGFLGLLFVRNGGSSGKQRVN